MNKLYFNFAGFNLSISFEPVNNAILAIERENIENEIKNKFKVFSIKKPSRVDCYISFVEKRREFAIFVNNKKNKGYYMRLFDETGNNRIDVYYSISFSQFQFILSQVLSKHLVNNDGFMTHSSSVLGTNGVMLFVGKSGAGKSTAANLVSKKFPTLTDDLGILKKEKEYNFYQAPFEEKAGNIKKSGDSYPINKVFILKKSTQFRAVKILNKSRILDQLISFNEANSVFSEKSSEEKYIKQLFNFVANFDEFYYLHFSKDSKKLTEFLSLQG